VAYSEQAVEPSSLGTRDAAIKALFGISSDLDQVESPSDGIGKPLYADSITEEQVRLGFSRIWLRFILILNFLVKLLLRVWMGGCIR